MPISCTTPGAAVRPDEGCGRRQTCIDSASGSRKTPDVTVASPSVSLRATRPRVRNRLPLAASIGVALVALLALTTGYLVHRTSSTNVTSGMAYSTASQIGVTTGGWSYNIPLQVRWRDASGSWHDASRAACLPPANRRVPVKFAWVSAHVDQVTWRAVVWVDCS